MKIIDTVHRQKLDLKISKFPDGQQNVEIKEYYNDINAVKITCSIKSFLDLELLVCATASLRELRVNIIDLEIQYLLGARSDRKFNKGGNNYLKQVICPIINSQGYRTVYILDPHSDVSEACINNFTKIIPERFINWIIDSVPKSNLKIILPDQGASKRIYPLVKNQGIQILECFKKRDLEGKITDIQLGDSNINLENSEILILDDICDGGRTFIEIAEKIQQSYTGTEIYLGVTHGIFSAGFEELEKYFKNIYTTNSYNTKENNLIKTYYL